MRRARGDHRGVDPSHTVAVLGAGTLGLCTIAALAHIARPADAPRRGRSTPTNARLAEELGADVVVDPGQLARAVRSRSRSLEASATLSGGADVVIDCVGSEQSLTQALGMVRPRGRVVLVGMPGRLTVDLASLWHREVMVSGAYAYGTEHVGGLLRRTFDLALELVAAKRLGRLVSARYPLDRFEEALAHAGAAGTARRGEGRLRPARPGTTAGQPSQHERTRLMSPRPGFVLEVDDSTPSTLFWHGEGYRLEKLPVGTRVLYAPEPVDALVDPVGSIRRALDEPLGDAAPLRSLLHSGMQLTIAFDDISLPLPPMRGPDVRQLVIEQVLELAAEAGVDDVVLIAALALHRRMTDAELRHALGERVFDAFAPHGLLWQHDAEDPDQLVHLGLTDQGEDVEINKRAATSDLLVYVNINLVAMDGGHKSVATGLASYKSLRHHHNAHTMAQSRSFMDQHRSELHSSNWRMGRLIAAAGVKVFQIETNLNTDTFPEQFRFLQRREWEWTARDRAAFLATSKALEATPERLARSIFHSIRAPHKMSSVQAGEVEAVHARTTENVYAQQLLEVDGQTDILTMGLPYICPYNVNSIMNPILVACLGLGYFFNMYRGQPLVRAGGCGDHEPSHSLGFSPRPSPELHRLLRAGAGGDDRPGRDREVRGGLRHRPVVHPPVPHGQRVSRRAPVLHVVLVCPRARACGRGDHRGRRPRRGATARVQAGKLDGRRARDGVGRRRARPVDHPSALAPAAHVRRPMSARRHPDGRA